MAEVLKFLAVFISLFILSVSPVNAQQQVVINEFSVDPTDNYDWIELFSSESVDISNWRVADEAGEFHVVPAGTLLGQNVYYVFSKYQRLNNDKDTIFLYDAAGGLKDTIKYGYAGEVCLPSSGGSIAKVPDGGGTYGRLLVATKEQSNGTTITDPCPTPSPTPMVTPTPTPTPTPPPDICYEDADTDTQADG